MSWKSGWWSNVPARKKCTSYLQYNFDLHSCLRVIYDSWIKIKKSLNVKYNFFILKQLKTRIKSSNDCSLCGSNDSMVYDFSMVR